MESQPQVITNKDTVNNFARLASIDVSKYIEKKNGLSYLSWAAAVDQLLRHDPIAYWTYGEPVKWGDTYMVFCTVTAFGKPMTAQLPVMDHRNKAIPNPDAFQVNVAMQRCLAKAIALHGLGLYVYMGEDLPQSDAEEAREQSQTVKSPKNPTEQHANGMPTDNIHPQTMSELAAMSMDAALNDKLESFLKEKGIQSIERLTEAQAQKLIPWLKKQLK